MNRPRRRTRSLFEGTPCYMQRMRADQGRVCREATRRTLGNMLRTITTGIMFVRDPIARQTATLIRRELNRRSAR